MTTVDGEVAPGFEPVRDAFARNFDTAGDVGAALAVYHHGTPVVDLWGGTADPSTGAPWQRDSLQLIYSATKAATATAAHLLAQRGELDLDAPVAEYWPEFAAEGKAAIPVRWLLSHRAGLPAIDHPVPVTDALRWDPMVEALAAQRPAWEPGTAHGYHGRTFGWLVGEVIRRVSGRSPGRYLADEVAAPLGLDLFVGLPSSERHRVTRMVTDPEPSLDDIPLDQVPDEFKDLLAALADPNSLMVRAFALTEPDLDFDAPETQAAEIPSSNGIASARALARLYAALLGELDGVRLLRPETVAAATREQAAGQDRVLMVPSRYASGYMLPTAFNPLGGPNSFGHPGRGGSLGYADPDTGTAFGYVVNHIRQDPADTRAADLVAALRQVVAVVG
jgi:CubicO group peptidase (beta-lactamase class C family)